MKGNKIKIPATKHNAQQIPFFPLSLQDDTPQPAAVSARHKPKGQHPNSPRDLTGTQLLLLAGKVSGCVGLGYHFRYIILAAQTS